MNAGTIIALASAAISFIEKSFEFLEARKQARELTPEEEQAYDDLVARRMTLPHWKQSKAK